MSLPHFYLDEQVLEHETGEHIALRLSADDLRHFKVLRLRVGEHIAVIDAVRDYFECEITDADWSAPKVRICTRDTHAETGAQVVLFQGMAKGDKLDTIVRQATEVGVAGMVFVPFARCVQTVRPEQLASRTARWEALAKSAAMQSGRRFIPEVSVLEHASDADEYLRGAHCVLVFWEEAAADARFEAALSAALIHWSCPLADARVAVVIGPEGGLEASEVEHILALNRHAAAVTLGPTILRTETAGVVAPALVLHALRALG